MTVTLRVAESIAIAIGTRQNLARLSEILNRKALLRDAHSIIAALGSVGREARIDSLQSQINDCSATRNDGAAPVDERMRQNGYRLHSEFKTLIEVPALKHATLNILMSARNVLRLVFVVATVAMPTSIDVLVVALFRRLARRSPENLALIVMRAARALIAISFPVVTLLGITLEHIAGTELGVALAVLGQIAFAIRVTTRLSGIVRHACRQVAATSRRTRGVTVEHTSVWIATRILAMLDHAAIALLARLDESIAADRRLKDLCRFVLQAIVHAVMQRQVQLVNAARAPVCGRNRGTGRRHYALLIWARAVFGVVFHAKVVAHLMAL